MLKLSHTLMVLALAVVGATTFTAQAADFTMKHKGVECASCHGKDTSLPPDRANCLVCHQEDQIVKATEHFNFESYFKDPKTGKETRAEVPINPHDNFHYGRSDQCVNCHKEHQPSTLTCTTCHDTEPWNMKPPR